MIKTFICLLLSLSWFIQPLAVAAYTADQNNYSNAGGYTIASVQTPSGFVKMKLVKDLDEEEKCAYKILKKMIMRDVIDPANIVFFKKVEIIKKNGLFQIGTRAKAGFSYFKSPSGAKIIDYAVILKNRVELTVALPKDSVRIKSFIAYSPQYKMGTKVSCFKYEWEVYNTGKGYATGNVVDTDYFINNENDYQHVDYVHMKYAIVKKNNRYGVLGKDSKVLLPVTFQYMIKNDFGLLVNDNGVYYFIDPLTRKKLSHDYADAVVGGMYHLKQKLFSVTRNGKMTLIDSTFKEITPLVYDNFAVYRQMNNRILVGKKQGQWMMIDSGTGKELGVYTENP